MQWPGVAAVVLVFVVVSGVAAGSDSEPPVAAAGLDQTVTEGTTVYLDAGGSHDPDGAIADYSWEITTPSGGTMVPDCPTCEQTRFAPTDPGEYEVRLTVADDDGETRSDTMFVTVEAADGPTVTLSGPSEASRGTDETYDVSADAGDAAIREVTLYRDGSAVESRSPDDASASFQTDLRLSDPGRTDLRAEVVDANGNTDEASIPVTVTGPPSPDISIEGPSETTVGSTEEYTVDSSTGDGFSSTIDFRRDEEQERMTTLSTFTESLTFDDTGTYDLRATVEDVHGNTVTATHTVTVVEESSDGEVVIGIAGSNCDEGTYVNIGLDGQECHVESEDGRRADAVLNDRIFNNNAESGIQITDGNGNIVTQIGPSELDRLGSQMEGDTISRSILSRFTDENKGSNEEDSSAELNNPGNSGDSSSNDRSISKGVTGESNLLSNSTDGDETQKESRNSDSDSNSSENGIGGGRGDGRGVYGSDR